jgi:lysine decarboxylase
MDSDEGRNRLDWSIEKCKEVIDRLNAIDRVEVFVGDPTDKTIYSKDITKILISIDGIKGSQIKKRLKSEYNIRLEMSDYYYALILTSLMNDEEDYEKVIAAIEDMAKTSAYEEINYVNINMPNPKIVISPAEAYYGKKMQVELKDAIGKLAAAPIIPYPPGIPLIVPGEEFTQEIYDHILFLMENGLEIVGLMGYNKDHIVVVER